MENILVAFSMALHLSATFAWSHEPTQIYNNEIAQNAIPARIADMDYQGQAKSSTQPPAQARMFHVIPAYGLVDAATQPSPLTSGQKFGLAAEYFNPYTFIFV